jgi:integrase/recombinase XerD
LKFLNLVYDVWLDYRKIETKKYKSDYIECLTETEFRLLENFIDRYEKYKINALRMELLCNIWYTSWLRLSEMLNLKISEVKKWECRITWKGNKTRWVFFTKSSSELLERYLGERRKPIPRTWKIERPSDFVFISHNSGYDYGNPLKKNTICEIMKRYSDAINLGKRITVHTLRHSYATRLLENGLNIREIQELLGHSDIQTTQNYCHVLSSNLKNKVMQVFN